MSQPRGDTRRLKLILGNQCAIGLINQRGAKHPGQDIDILASIDPGLADSAMVPPSVSNTEAIRKLPLSLTRFAA